MVEMRGSHSEALPPAPCQVTLKGDFFKKVNISRISSKSVSLLKTYGSGGGRKVEKAGSTQQPNKKEHPQHNSLPLHRFSKNGTDYGACLSLFCFSKQESIAEMRMIPHRVNSL